MLLIPPLRLRFIRRLASIVLVGGLGLAVGCEAISADIDALAKGIVPPTPTQAVHWANGRDPDLRRDGLLLLANAPFGGDPLYVDLYRMRLEEDLDPLVQAIAIRALGKHGEPEDALPIATHLDHENVQVRWEAAKALQRLHNPRVVPALLRMLDDVEEKSDVRVAAAVALGQYPEDRVFQGLVAALEVRELAINEAARQSLETLTGQSFSLDRRPWLAWYDGVEGDPFAGRQDYLYPTYDRKESWLEQLAFWTHRVVEQPAPPAGLRQSTERRTYGDEEQDEEGQTEGG